MRPAASAAARASSYERAGTSAVEYSLSAPATDTDSSSSGVSPLVPMAAITSPSTVSGMPPVNARAPCSARGPQTAAGDLLLELAARSHEDRRRARLVDGHARARHLGTRRAPQR